MDQYNGLARIYDYLVSGVDFDGWIEYIESLLRHFNIDATSVVDLACGTGNTAIPFAKRGYRVTGIDLSKEMLQYADQKARAHNLQINFLHQDMRQFELPEQADLITCFHDGLNYLTKTSDIQQTFKQVSQYLSNRGAFIFDLNAVKWLAGSGSEVCWVDDQDMTLIWETNYNAVKQIWHINLTGFVREGSIYRKFQERHCEKAYSPDEISTCLTQADLTLLGSFDAFTFNPIHHQSIRHFYVAQKVKPA